VRPRHLILALPLLPKTVHRAAPEKRALPQLGLRGSSALARRFQTLEQQREQGVDPRRGTRLVPFLGVHGMVEAAGGIENGARRKLDGGDLTQSLPLQYVTRKGLLQDPGHPVEAPTEASCYGGTKWVRQRPGMRW
jgi:hypothetical protein